MYNRDNIVLRGRGKANIPFKILHLLWSCGKCLNRFVQDSRMLSQLALFLHSKILHINCFQRSPMSLNSHLNDSRHVPLLMISLTERITPISQLPAPTPVVVRCGMLIRGKGRYNFGQFHCFRLKREPLERTLKPFTMFLITIRVLWGETIFKPSSK